MSNWVGYAVSVNCGEPLGCYQGTILEADGTTITLTKAFRNGFPYPKSQVTLNAADIKELRIIEEARSEQSSQTHSTVAVTKSNKKAQRATVCENLQAAHTSSGNQQNGNNGNTNTKTSAARSSGTAPPRSKPIDIQGTRNTKINTHSGSLGAARGGERARRRNEACFGDAAHPALHDDFDFEGNLALFDKQALWEQMRAAARPDVVRAADDAARSFRHDEHVLPPHEPDGIAVPAELCAGAALRTDDGRRVPPVTEHARRLLWDAIVRSGPAVCGAAYVLLARAAADVALRLVGGGRRLEARNAHQAPAAVALAAPHRTGAAALAAARILASHAATATVLLVGDESEVAACEPLQQELAALALGGARVTRDVAALPAAPDLVLLALHDPRLPPAPPGAAEAAALRWAGGVRGAVLALEPRAAAAPGVWCRAAVCGALPAAPAPALGQLFLADVAPPPALFRALGIRYRPPFGASSVVALH
ncbi:enhancer of mRNA-decapping protein 3 [Epargyreus clarus]|uniref:enhancer of mRNA-decapping protein 3 n=1 Tax=Epargyreus clarus TaxID=520877 RepID=UPI003C2D2A10